MDNVTSPFPPTFGLRSHRGETFRISERNSYINDQGTAILIVQRQLTERNVASWQFREYTVGEWLDFSKGSYSEIQRLIIDSK